MTNFLTKIGERKKREVSRLKGKYSIEKGVMDTRFRVALEKRGIIAEIKRRSPSKGALSTIPHPELLAQEYEEAGAIAISCLTDEAFDGTIEDLRAVTAHVTLPVLRKDFIIDPLQIVEAKKSGAAAVLLIVKLVGENLSELLSAAALIGVEVLVEVHTEEELQFAIRAGADIIGINNRDLTTLKVDPRISYDLYQKIPEGIHIIIESGITDSKEAHFFFDHGASACLIGEKLVTTHNRSHFIQDSKSPYVKICGVRTRDIARLSGESGADFIGIICEESSPRFVSPEGVKNVALGAKEGGSLPVCVFTKHSADEMRSICLGSGVSVVQLHGENSRKEQVNLPEEFIRIFVQPVEKDGSYQAIDFPGLNRKRDYILYDCQIPGSGSSFNWERFVPRERIPFFLAGGLDPGNVSRARDRVSANGFDVSSGVENVRGSKDIFLIQEFISRIKK